MKSFIKFSIVGSIGFLVDALILLFFVEILNIQISVSRFCSFITAVYVTWKLNKSFTFKTKNLVNKGYKVYLFIQFIGASLNYVVFMFLVTSNSFFEKYLIIPLAISSITTMFFNFFMIKKNVFK